MRNPKWHRDEIILALALYFSEDRGAIDAKNPKIIHLSRILNSLPAIQREEASQTYRNPNGVGMKLANFVAIESGGTRGMSRYSKLDEEVFFEFFDKKETLREIAQEILEVSAHDDVAKKIRSIESDDEEIINSVIEGATLYKLHKYKERNKRIVDEKKKQALRMSGTLECEICSFDFYKVYGDVGKGFIECHHRIPLASLKVATKTSLDDLALVCANCHRILHRRLSAVSVDGLKNIVRSERS